MFKICNYIDHNIGLFITSANMFTSVYILWLYPFVSNSNVKKQTSSFQEPIRLLSSCAIINNGMVHMKHAWYRLVLSVLYVSVTGTQRVK